MALEWINPSDVYEPNSNNYTQVVKATGGTQVHVAGTVSWDKEKNLVGGGDMKTQVIQIMDNIGKSLAAAGAKPSDVVRICVYAVDVDRYIQEGAAEVVRFFGDTKPVSTTFEVARLVRPDWLVEIEATAIVD